MWAGRADPSNLGSRSARSCKALLGPIVDWTDHLTRNQFMLATSIVALIGMGVVLTLTGPRLAPDRHQKSAVPQVCQPVPLVAGQPQSDMVWIPGGRTALGSDRYLPEERPRRMVDVPGFWILRHEVTNGEFAAFVAATGYKTFAERAGNGGAVFKLPDPTMVNMADMADWWQVDPKASWRRPDGAGSNIDGRENDPVVQVVYEDALAYAKWRGQDLPSEAEWERAARGGLNDAEFTWGEKVPFDGKSMANIWQGTFPLQDEGSDGFKGRAPVGCFPPNGYGLFDMAGNVWEIVADPWKPNSKNHVIKGGSYLCADNYCLRYRPAARQPGDDTLGTSHIGFRTVSRAPGP